MLYLTLKRNILGMSPEDGNTEESLRKKLKIRNMPGLKVELLYLVMSLEIWLQMTIWKLEREKKASADKKCGLV